MDYITFSHIPLNSSYLKHSNHLISTVYCFSDSIISFEFSVKQQY